MMRARVGELMLQADDSGTAGAAVPGVAGGGGGGGGALPTAGLAAFAAAAFASCAQVGSESGMLTSCSMPCKSAQQGRHIAYSACLMVRSDETKPHPAFDRRVLAVTAA